MTFFAPLSILEDFIGIIMSPKHASVRPISMAQAVREAYRSGQEDESLEPIVKTFRSGKPRGRIADGDSVIFYDLRGEREVELTQALTLKNFKGFPRAAPRRLHFVTMIEYDPRLPVRVAFPAETRLRNTLVEVLCRSGRRVAKIAESEKAVHIGFFLNGKTDDIFPGEERLIVPSPDQVESYAWTPEMSADRVAEEVVAKLNDDSFPVIIANFANVDVIGHTEDRNAVLRAVRCVDTALGRIVAASREVGATLVVTSDHGTVEEWLYPEGSINTGHTKNPVPFILADYSAVPGAVPRLRQDGELADVAPTLLELSGVSCPPEMTGQSLLLPSGGPPTPRKKIVLLILDGWGLRDDLYGNLIREASTPYYDSLWASFPHAALRSYGEAVGMPAHAVGNSEAGHLHIGAGRRVALDRVRVDRSIADGSFFRNRAFLWAMDACRKKNKALHLMGIISHYSSHGTIRHLLALLEMARQQGLNRVFIHGFIGRRGERPESGAFYVEKVEEEAARIGLGDVVTIMGRYWALDREHHWDRVEKAYRALVIGEGTRVSGA